MDRRTVTGLQKAQQRSEGPQAEHSGALLNWVSIVDVATTLCTADLTKYSDEELFAMCKAVQVECPDFPPNVQCKILQRASQKHLQNREYHNLLKIMLPCGVAKWSNDAPVLAAVDCDEANKLITWESLYFKTMLSPLLKKGQHGQPDVQKVCETLIEILHGDFIDYVEVGPATAQSLGNATTICNCLLALMQDSLDIGKKDLLVVNLLLKEKL